MFVFKAAKGTVFVRHGQAMFCFSPGFIDYTKQQLIDSCIFISLAISSAFRYRVAPAAGGALRG
jgi:hypothetical protein